MSRLAGRYTIVKEIGRGGMGVVYEGVDTATGQQVAIKRLKGEVAQRQPELVERFVREAEALRTLNHPNIVKAYAALTHEDEQYIVMEYVPGEDLSSYLSRSETLPMSDIMRIGIELADALTRAHYLKIIHRDLKPANILITPQGTPKLTDFGVAYMATEERMTTIGLSLGTPDYMAPEALDGHQTDGRGDIWALGVILFEMITGQHPFASENIPQMMLKVMTQPVPDIEHLREDCPVPLADLVYRMLEKSIESRIPSVRLVGAELEAMMRGETGTMKSAILHLMASDDRRFETPTPVSQAVRHNLSAPTTAFVGREEELLALNDLMDAPTTRLITLLGPGGIGKTRLVLELAHELVRQIGSLAQGRIDKRVRPRFVNGVFLVPLASVRAEDGIVTAIADAVGFKFQAGSDARQQLLDFFHEKHMLLILDSCEHMLDSIDVISGILQTAPNVTVIATSRAKLNLQGEVLFNIEGLTFDETADSVAMMNASAIKLFVHSARRAQPTFELKPADLPHVARICALVRGMPLGLELAAAWVEMLTPQEIADEVTHNLDFLESESHDTPGRHRSLRAVFDHSWNLLTPEERETFIRVAVFRGRFTRHAGQTVTGAGLRQLMALVNKSLLRRDPDTGEYQIHEVLRQYAQERLDASGFGDEVRQAHSDYVLKTLASLLKDLQSARQIEALHEVEADLPNLRAALMVAAETNHTTFLLGAVHPLGIYIDARAQYTEGLALFEPACAALRKHRPSAERDDALAYLLLWASVMSGYYRQRDRSEAQLVEAEGLIRDDSPAEVRAFGEFSRGYFELLLGDVLIARERLQRAREQYRLLDRVWDEAHITLNLGTSFFYRTDSHLTDIPTGHAIELEARALIETRNDVYMKAHILTSLSRTYALMRDYATAKDMAAEAQILHRRVGNWVGVGATLLNLGIWNLILGQFKAGRQALNETFDIQRDRGNVIGMSWAMQVRSRLEFAAGDFTESLARARQALTFAERVGVAEYINAARFAMARAYWAMGSYGTAVEFYEKLYENANANNSHAEMCMALNGLTDCAMSIGDLTTAEDHLFIVAQLAPAMDDLNLTAAARLRSAQMQITRGQAEHARQNLVATLTYFLNEDIQRGTHVWDDGNRQEAMMRAWVTQADAERALGHLHAARESLMQALELSSKNGAIPYQLMALVAAAELIAQNGDQVRASDLAATVMKDTRAFAVDRARASALLMELPPPAMLHPTLESAIMAFYRS